MKKAYSKKGFTIIEVALVLGVTGLMFAGLAASMNGAISRQHYFDASQDFAQFLRNQYSAVTSVQSTGYGQSNVAIYGKMITFNEKPETETVYVYDIVGEVLPSSEFSGLDTISGLITANARIRLELDEESNSYFYPNEQQYSPIWDIILQTTSKEGERFSGTIIIARSPLSGIVHTYYSETTLSAQAFLESIGENRPDSFGIDLLETTFKNDSDLNFCLHSDTSTYSRRRNVRLSRDGHNSSAVNLLDLDSEDNLCEV